MKQMLAEQVHEIVQELRAADYHTVGTEFFESRFSRMSAGGWKLGILAFSQKVTHGHRGRPLATPKNEWRNVAYLYNEQAKIKVWFWNNPAITKTYAQDLAQRTPAPDGAVNYITFNKSNESSRSLSVAESATFH